MSLFGDIGPTGATPDSPLGPGWTTFVVKGPLATDTVTIDLKTFFLSLLPQDMDPSHTSYATGRIPAANRAAWENYLNSISATPMTWDAAGGIWKKAFELDDLFQVLGGFIGSGPALNMVLEDLRLGGKTVPVTAKRGSETTTANISIAVVDAQIPLRRGWNARSVPFALSPNTWANLKTYATPGVTFSPVIRWDAQNQKWVTVDDTYVVKPLEAFYIYASADAQIGAIMNRSYTAPPTRSLYAGWNLVGTAPDFVKNFAQYYPKTGTGAKMRGLMKADDNFISILKTADGKTGYTMVLSIGQDVSYTTSYMYGTYNLGNAYPWLFGQPAWGYTTLNSAAIDNNPVTSGNYFGWTVPFGAYWVYMENADTLAGFTTTPVSKDWLAYARKQILGF